MGMKYVVECDGLDCTNETQIDEPTNDNVEDYEWYCDPHDTDFHYCPSCAPAAKAEHSSEPYIEM